ncbi:MAG: DAK2 domain-containing protein [Micrococcales bacterium]|nr:DAK2 domain-containing protein [Micrococcales bacterium]
MGGGPMRGDASDGADVGNPATDRLRVLDLAAVRRWAVIVRAAFASRRVEIDALNVFPVPDGDTGTNLYLTLDAALDKTRDREPAAAGAGERLTDFAKSLLWTARGNSGVILSQIVRGFAEGCAGAEVIDVPVLVRGLVRADELAWQAVTDPKEGTILSVSRAVAETATAHADEDLRTVSVALRDAARVALEHTTDQLPVLARAGVVDAGGAGLVIIIEALERVCAGEDVDGSAQLGTPDQQEHPWTRQPTTGCSVAADDLDGMQAAHIPEFEVMYLLADSTEDQIRELRQRLVELGDSVLVVGGDGLWNVHAHVDDAGGAVEAGLAAGRPHRVRITSLSAESEAPGPDQRARAALPLRAGGSGLVACAAGEGIAEVFRASGALAIASAPGQRASTGQFVEAIHQQHAAGVSGVVVLPNDGDTQLAAAAAVRAASDDGVEAYLVQARTVVQGLAALAVFEQRQSAADNALAMQAAASATRHGGVTVSNREALTSGGPCEPGDILGIVDGDIVIVGSDQETVGVEVVRRLLASGGELLTVVTGADAPEELTAAIVRAARDEALGLEVTHIRGGQAVYSVLLGVE